jgi:alpha-tubulin suppressor-like RCC1 family protein
MRFIEIPALITEDIEDPSIVDITEPISASISGTTMTIDGGSKVSGEATITLTGDTTVNAFTLQNIRAPSLHKISVKTNGKGNFTYVPNDDVTASSLSTTSKTGSDFEILLISTTGGETYVDFDMADYTSPAVYTSNALTGFDVSELTSTYGATAKLYKPDGTLLTTVSSAASGSGIGFGYVETTPQDVTYTLEVTDDLGRTSRYDLPRKWISYAMSAPGFEKLALAGNEYTTTTIVPNLTSSSKARIYKTGNHGYLGINFKIQGRNSTEDDWENIDSTGENDEFQAFGNFLYHRVWVKPTAKATTTVSSSNVVTLTLTDLTEENLTTSTSFVGLDPYDINESTNTYVFEETTKIGTVPFTVTLDTETYTNAFTATTEGTAYDYVTLAFANPTLSLTTSNVTISSAKLYKDDVLFHTYGTESNVVLRSDQTGTYQAIVNDVYYSNRVTPDFTTTRSVSAPQLEFDGYNRLNLSNITPTSSTLGLPDGTTRDLTTQSNVYIYETGTYTANVQSSDTFAYLSNVVTSQPSQHPTDVGPTLTFDNYNRLAISNITPTSASLRLDSNTYDTNTASNVYVTDAGEYKLEARDANTFVMSNVYVGALDTQVDYTNLTSMYYGGAVTDVNGVLYTWGHDGYGNSGRGASDRIPTAITSISDPVSNVWRGTPGYTVAAKTSTDKWYMWGRNTYSAVLGNTTNTGNVTTPEDVTAKVTEYFGDQTVSANKIIKMAMGEHHAVALTAGGKVWSWGGDYTYYATGTGTNNNTVLVTPVLLKNITVPTGQDLTIIGGGRQNSNYVFYDYTSGGEVAYYLKKISDDSGVPQTQFAYNYVTRTWVDKNSGNIPVYFSDTDYDGVNAKTTTSVVNPEYLYAFGSDGTSLVFKIQNPHYSSSDIPDLSDITNVEAVYDGTAALDSSGNVWFWGGSNGSMQYAYPTKILDSTSVSGIVGLRATNAGTLFAWKSDGTFYTRGRGSHGQLANGSEADQYASWQTVTTLQGKTIKKVFGGNENMFVWTNDGVYGVGRGNNYKLGNGSTSNRSTFHKSNTISALSIREIDFGHATGLVLTTDGRGYMWGEDANNSMANALSGNQSGAAEATSISALSFSLPLLPTLTFDGYNKLTIENVDSIETATIKKDDVAFATTTSNTVYIRDTGTYTAEVKGSGAYAIELSKEVTGTISQHPTDVVPSLTYDNYNKITIENTNYADTTNVTYYSNTYELGTAKTMYVKDAGEYVFKISGTDKYVESNVYVSSVDLAGASTKPIDFDGYNKLTLIDAGSNVSANVTYFSNTYELGSANVLYINGAGTYGLEMSGSNVFALSSNVVGTVSQHPTDVVPSLTFDNYNKLTLENFTTSESDTRTAKLTDPNDVEYTLGQTQNDIYIEETGDYTLEVTNSDQSAVVKKNVGAITIRPQVSDLTYEVEQYTDPTDNTWKSRPYGPPPNLWYNGTSVVMYQTTIPNGDTGYVTRIAPGSSNYGGDSKTWSNLRTQELTFKLGPTKTDWGSYEWPVGLSNDVMLIDFSYDSGPHITINGNNNSLAYCNSGSLQTEGQTNGVSTTEWNHLVCVKNSNNDVEVYLNGQLDFTFTPPQSKPAYPANRRALFGPRDLTGRNDIDFLTYNARYYPAGKILSASEVQQRYNYIFNKEIPTLTFDTYNKLSINNLTPTSSRLTYGSNTYEIGTASNVYIEHAGTYKMATGDANTFALVSNVVTGTPSQHPTDVGPTFTFDTSNKLSITGITPTATTLTDPNGSSLDIGTVTDVYIRDSGKYAIASKDANTFVLTSNTVTGTPTGTTYVYDSNTFTTPSQTYDTVKTITVSNVPSTLPNVVGKIYKGSTAYTIHATEPTTNVIIEEANTYLSVFTTATQAFLTNVIDVSTQPTTTNEDNTIEDEATLVTTTVTSLQEQEPETFSYTGAIQTYTVPDGVTSIKVKCWGSAGGARNGGAGGYAGGDVSVTPGETLQVAVGQGGPVGSSSVYLGSGGGFTGILSVWNTSDIAATHAGSIIIAGAGGGGGNSDNNPAGNGGGETGGVGENDNGGARPGTQIAAGSAESDSSAAANPSGGSYFRGGNSAGDSFYAGTPWPAGVWGGNYQRSKAGGGSQGGGGGGGYYGAGGAGNRNSVNSRGAAGGSGYIGGDGTHEVTNGENLATSLTQKSSLPPKTDDEHYVSGVGTPATTDASGGNGIVVIIATKEVTTTTTTGGLAGSTAVPSETVVDAPSATLDATDTTATEPTLNLDFTTTLPRTLKRYNGLTNSSIGARFNRRETRKKRIEKSISIPSSFSAELTANNASSPTTLTVTVANSKFVINGDETPTLGFIRGETYTFDQSDSSNSGHPLVLATSADGAQYTTGWTASGTPGTDGSHVFTVPYDVPDTIYYKCSNHNNMGGEIHTTFGTAFSLGDFDIAANTHVSGEYTLAVNYDGTTSNLYVNGSLITQTTTTISAGTKDFILGKEFDGYVKNFTFWNYAKVFVPPP